MIDTFLVLLFSLYFLLNHFPFFLPFSFAVVISKVFFFSLLGSISRLIREHAHPGAILASGSSSFRSSLFSGIRQSPSANTAPSLDFSVEHPLLSRQQSTSERATNTNRVSRVRVLRSDRNRRGHMTHIHVHYPHPHGMRSITITKLKFDALVFHVLLCLISCMFIV